MGASQSSGAYDEVNFGPNTATAITSPSRGEGPGAGEARPRSGSAGVSRPGKMQKKGTFTNEDNWDFFVSFEEESAFVDSNSEHDSGKNGRLSLPPPESHPPAYILEASLEDQELWYKTAGQRPPQPADERKYFEELWRHSFESSEAARHSSTGKARHAASFASGSKASRHRGGRATGQDHEVLYRGRAPFSYAVSKTFVHSKLPCMTLQIPRFEIRKSPEGRSHAEFLIIVTFNRLTFGIWRRFSQFKELFRQVSHLNGRSASEKHEFSNSILSWQCLTHRQRCFRCLDKEYVALKCFLLERFLHDLLFESQNPDLLINFLGMQ